MPCVSGGIQNGSAMDCARAVGVRVTYPRRTVNQLGGKLKAWRKLPTFIAIPTTAGTGSETTLAAMITDSETHHKYAIMSFPVIPLYPVPKLMTRKELENFYYMISDWSK